MQRIIQWHLGARDRLSFCVQRHRVLFRGGSDFAKTHQDKQLFYCFNGNDSVLKAVSASGMGVLFFSVFYISAQLRFSGGKEAQAKHF